MRGDLRLGPVMRVLVVVAVFLANCLVVLFGPASAPPVAAAPKCAAEAPDEASAARMARMCARAVEITVARTERSQVFAQPDGTRRLRASAKPERIRRADGSWTPIRTDLRRRADGRYAPVASPADVSFSGGGRAPLVTWREAGSTFQMSWPGALPAPRVSGATATYPGVLADVDLHVTATAEGFVHTVEVKTAAAMGNPAVRQLRYLTGGDMRVSTTADGAVRLTGKQGQPVAIARSPLMWDSSSDPATAGEVLPQVAAARAAGRSTARPEPASPVKPAVTSRTAPVAVTAERGQLRVAADQRLLADPDLTYPVFIDPQFEKQRWTWAYATSNGENNDGTAARVGKQPPDQYSSNGQLYRSYYGFDVGALGGKHILSGTVRITLDHSWSCGPTWVNLYRVAALTVSSGGRMSWTTRPLPSGVTLDWWAGNANESGGCGEIQPDVDAEFTGEYVRNDLQYFADGRWGNYAVGLCACNSAGDYESEQDRWKKFYTDKAHLEVTYNSYPSTPANLTSAGKVCGSTIGTNSVKLRAQYLDVDGAEDALQGTFVYKQLPSGTPVTVTDPVIRPANNYGEVTVNLGSTAEGKTYSWQVRTKDEAGDYSPWSAWCNFTVNTKAGAVKVTGTPYINCEVAPSDPTCNKGHGGPGVSGSFTFAPDPNDAGAQYITSYVYKWKDSPQAATTVPVPQGGSYTAALTPPRHGLNALEVFGKNAAGVPGATNTYQFLVGSPSAPLAHWLLSTVDGAGYRDVLGDGTGDTDLVVDAAANDVTWRADTRLIGESAVRFDATAGGTPGWMSAAGTGLDTSGSFSVSAWVRLATTSCPTNLTAVSVDGTNVSGFMLSYDCLTGKWRMLMADVDQPSTVLTQAASSNAAVVNQWTHLVGVFDEAERKVRLYVDGQLVADVTPASTWLAARGAGWKANGSVVVGRDRYAAQHGSFFSGEIADVRVWNRVVVADDILGTNADVANGVQDTAGLMAPIEVAAWTFNGALDGVCADAISDGTYWQPEPTLALQGCTDPYSPGQTAGYTGEGHDSNDALWLNHAQPDGFGTTGAGHAAHSGPVLRTDQSFTVSAWVRIADLNGFQGVISQDGDNMSAFRLDFDPWAGNKWCFRMLRSDSPSASDEHACGPTPKTGSWEHLVAVYDAGKQELRLYVDGKSVATASYTGTPWQAQQQFNVGRLLFTGDWGRHFDYFRGSVDQVRLFAGAMSDRQVAKLCDCPTTP